MENELLPWRIDPLVDHSSYAHASSSGPTYFLILYLFFLSIPILSPRDTGCHGHERAHCTTSHLPGQALPLSRHVPPLSKPRAATVLATCCLPKIWPASLHPKSVLLPSLFPVKLRADGHGRVVLEK
jgi:hypothetical protein